MWVALLLTGPVTPPMPALERQKPIPKEQPSLQLDSFQLKIDQQEFDCSAGALDTGNKAPHAYSPSNNRFESELQIHAARCKTRF
tara:strand:+ start:308 stop:562 length:255 start_codon:yes stop_codon:yes gene_type:complete